MRAFAIAALLTAFAALLPVARPAAAEPTLAGQPVSVYRERRQKLLEQIKDGIVVMVGAREEDFGEVGRFRQKNDFMYLTGVATPAAYLMLVPAGLIPDKPAQEVIFIPKRNPYQERWTGPQLGPGEEAQTKFGAQEVAAADTFQARLGQVLAAAKAPVKLYTVVPHGSTAAMTREHLFIEALKKAAPAAPVAELSPLLHEMRKVKSPSEVALLQKAIDITVEAHHDTAAAIRPGAYEYQVQAALEYAFARNGAERPGFPSIVGSGVYSTVLHYNENRKQIEAGDLIVVDIGAEYSYYTADITRTFPATGKFTPRQREVYQLVLDAQRAAEKAFKLGETSIGDLQRAAVEVMRKSPLRDKQGNTLDRYFLHGLGHWLGMDVHDVGNYTRIPAGAVFTIEPGIYIPDEKLGVRIEDDYLATPTGLVKLSGKLASDPDEVERLMAAKSRPAGATSR